MSHFIRAGKVGTVAALGAGALVFLAPQAGAWHASLEATPVCVGTIPTINWTVTESVAGGVVTITDNHGHTSKGPSSGVLPEAEGTTSAILTLNVTWSNGVQSNSTTSVTFPNGCLAVTTTTTTAPTTTTTTEPTTTTTVPATTTTTTPATTSTSVPVTTTTQPITTTTAPSTSPGKGTTTSTSTTIGATTTIEAPTTTVPVQPSTSPATGTATAVPATLTDGPSSTGLAFTGYNAQETGGIGGLLITGGVVALWVARRRYAAKHLKK